MGQRPGFVPSSASVDEVGRTFVRGFGSPPSPSPSPGSGGDIAPRPSWGCVAPQRGFPPGALLPFASLGWGFLPPPAAQSWGLPCFSDAHSSRSAQPSPFS